MPRTADLMVIHDIADEAARESLAGLLRVAGERVEIEELDSLHVVALIDPCDLENSPEDGANR